MRGTAKKNFSFQIKALCGEKRLPVITLWLAQNWYEIQIMNEEFWIMK